MTPDEFLAAYSPEVREIAAHLRALVGVALAGAGTEEFVFPGWKNISYGTGASRRDADLICYIAPLKGSVNLGFYRGALLPDPAGLLTGTGKLLRHAKFAARGRPDDGAVLALLAAARRERLPSGG